MNGHLEGVPRCPILGGLLNDDMGNKPRIRPSCEDPRSTTIIKFLRGGVEGEGVTGEP